MVLIRIAGGEGRGVKVQRAVHGLLAVQHPAGGFHGYGGGGIVDSAVFHRLELDGVAAVKDDGGDGGGEFVAGGAVEDHVAHGGIWPSIGSPRLSALMMRLSQYSSLASCAAPGEVTAAPLNQGSQAAEPPRLLATSRRGT